MSDRPRVLLVSEDLALPSDEGLKKFVYSIADPLRDLVELSLVSTQPSGPVGDGVTVAPANLLMNGRELKQHIDSFTPSHIVYVPRSGGTRNAFIRSRRLQLLAPQARMAMVMLQSRTYGRISGAIARRLQPDLVIAQGPSVRRALVATGIHAVDIPSGVDVSRFSPPTADRKASARERLGIDGSSPVVLHVGHLKRDRNVALLARIRAELHCESVLVASTSTVPDPGVKDELTSAGVRVVDSYIPDITDVYAAADCYVFPVHTVGNAIEMPLSVLEAMACGLPVVATRFGSLPDWLSESDGVTFANDDDDIVRGTAAALAHPADAEVSRQAACRFSWTAIAGQLLGLITETEVETSAA